MPKYQNSVKKKNRKECQSRQAILRANWPNLTSLIPNPQKCSPARSISQDGLQCNIDPFIGMLMADLKELGSAENTLVIAMADNEAMSHNLPPGTEHGRDHLSGR
ncbi:MAG: hypothetical protein KJP23_28460 [Deltaproteobacteria bacterium]|nr:hypothetical protein [Deltaproteobacteria bacterium]